MKVWIKYLIGIALGIGAAFILPLEIPAVNSIMNFFYSFTKGLGEFILLPFIIFSVTTGIFKLRRSRTLSKTMLWTGAVILGTTFVLALLGLLSALIVKLPRIPITGEKVTEISTISISSMFMGMFPFSGITSMNEAVFILPCFIFAVIAGLGCALDENTSKPVTNFFESAAKICYSVMSFFVEWLSVGMIAVACYWMANSREVFASDTYIPLIIMLAVDFVIVFGIIYPLVLRFLCKDLHPQNFMLASICPVLTGFISADSNLSLQVNLRHARESMGLHSQTADSVLPLFSTFARGGSSLVLAVCFVTILRSYSSLEITLFDTVWIFGMTFAVSLVLSSVPSGGTFAALTVLCALYSRGFEAGYLLLKSAAPILCSFAAAFDAATAIFGSYVVAVKTKNFTHVEVKHFI